MTSFFFNLHLRPTRLSRSLALLLTGTVLILAVFAASPNAHHWLHADADHQDHTCAVTLFAHDVTVALAGVVLAVVAWRLLGFSRGVGAEVYLLAPRYLLMPGRGPPRG